MSNTLGILEVNLQELIKPDFPLNQMGEHGVTVSTAYGDIPYRTDPYKPVTVRVRNHINDVGSEQSDTDKMALFTSATVGSPWILNKEVGLVQKHNFGIVKTPARFAATVSGGNVVLGNRVEAGLKYDEDTVYTLLPTVDLTNTSILALNQLADVSITINEDSIKQNSVLTATIDSNTSLNVLKNQQVTLVPKSAVIPHLDVTTLIPLLAYKNYE